MAASPLARMMPGNTYTRGTNRAANDPSVLTITEKAPTTDFFWLKTPTSALTFKAPKLGK